MKDTEDIAAYWAEKLGLVEVLWFSSLEPGRHSVLLDGGRGSFGLSTGATRDFDSDQAASWAWSSDLAHHVLITDDEVTVSRWDDPSALRRWSRTSVENKIETFYDYLLADSVKNKFDVVEHSIDVFRRIRSYLYENRLPDESSIHVFLFLIASMLSAPTENVFDDAALLTTHFALDDAHLESFQRLGKDTLVALVEQFRLPSEVPRTLEMIPELLVRHAGGTVFQEAHFEIIRSSPTDLFSLPGRATVRIDTRGGTHFTPPPLARAVVEQAFWNVELGEAITILDPSCGAGAFLHEVLRYLQRIEYQGRVSLVGFDISENAVAIARFVLAQAVKDWADIQLERLEIRAQDSLGEMWPECDFILMNPPFISWGGLTGSQRSQVKEILGKRYVGRPDYSMAFITKAVSSLRAGGVVGALVPSSVLSTEASLGWRRHLLEQVSPIFVAVLGDYGIFRHAIVEVGCVVLCKTQQPSEVDGAFLSLWTSEKRGTAGEGVRHLRKLLGARREGHPVKSTTSLTGDGWRVSQMNTKILRDLPDWRPRPNRLGDVLEQIAKAFDTTVGDVFHVREGIRAGLRKAFILSAEIYQQLPAKERKFFRPIAENKNIREGRIGSHDFIFYPQAPGLEELSSEDDLRRLVPIYYERYLEPNRQELAGRKALRGRDWWVLNWERSYFKKPAPKIVTAFFGDAGSFALDLDGTYVVVQGFAWFFQSNIRKSIEVLPEEARELTQKQIFCAYLAILNSTVFSLLLAEFCPHVAGGQFNLSRRFIDHVPLPNLSEASQQSPELGSVVWALADEGARIHSGTWSTRVSSINDLVGQIYRVPFASWPITDK